jgi:hypothetical protein
MVVRLHQAGLISRVPGQARSIRVRVAESEIPALADRGGGDHRKAARTGPLLPFVPPVDDGDPNATDDGFPTSEVFVDCCGTPHEFALELVPTGRGYFLRAIERMGDDDGYMFAAHSESDPYLALGRLRARIHEGLATRYLTHEAGFPMLSHEVARGHIAYEGIVIDGQHLSYDELARLLGAYEGWQFTLTIVDGYDAT